MDENQRLLALSGVDKIMYKKRMEEISILKRSVANRDILIHKIRDIAISSQFGLNRCERIENLIDSEDVL